MEAQTVLTIAQTILFNMKQAETTPNVSKCLPSEPPLPFYGLKVHTLTRSKKLVSELNELGLCVSYYRLR
jgi:hypothetical protein